MPESAGQPHRSVSRPWAADAYLNEVMTFFVTSRNSMIQKIDRSQDLRRIFTKHCNNLESGILRTSNLLISLRSAKHRFESLASPMGLWVMWFLGLCMTAREITIKRTGPEVACAQLFMEYVTTSKCVLMGMMADAADDALCHTRRADSFDQADPADINNDVYCFLLRIIELYQEGKVVHVFSYTKYILEVLRLSPIVLQTSSNTFKTVGDSRGVAAEVVQECLQRMSAWVKLCIHVIRAEYPAVELLHSFSVFQLDDTKAKRQRDMDRERNVRKLAQAFHLDPVKLMCQMNDFFHVAWTHARSSGCSSVEGWIFALRKVGLKRRGHTDVHELKECLYRYVTWKACTSRLEQDFSKMKIVMGVNRLHGRECCEGDVAKVVLDCPTDEPTQQRIIETAQSLWSEHYGVSRQGCATSTRIDTGSVRKRTDEDGTQLTRAAFLRRRRNEATGLVDALPVEEGLAKIERAASTDLGESWTEGHQKELEFQARKQRQRECESYNRHHLVPAEISPALAAEASNQLCDERQRAAENQRKHERDARKLRGGKAPELDSWRGKSCYVCPEVRTPLLLDRLGTIGVHLVQCVREPTDIAIARDPAVPGNDIAFTMKLRGGIICVPEVALGTRSGPVIAYERAVAVQRKVWVSDQFRTANATFYELLVSIAGEDTSKWVLLDSPHEFESAKAAAQRQSKSPQVLGLVTQREAVHLKQVWTPFVSHTPN